jgi:hypothetical protein
MKRAYVILGLVALVPVLHGVACGDDGNGSQGSGGAGGAGLDVITDLTVNWTVLGKAPTTDQCATVTGGAATVQIILGGTIDTTAHDDKTVACEAGTVSFSKLDGLRLGGTPLIEGYLLNPQGFIVFSDNESFRPVEGALTITLDFAPIDTTTTTTTADTTGNGGFGGMGSGGAGQGGAGVGGAVGPGGAGQGGAAPAGVGGASTTTM